MLEPRFAQVGEMRAREHGVVGICNCCGRRFRLHPKLKSNGFPHCPKCLGVEGRDFDLIKEGAFD